MFRSLGTSLTFGTDVPIRFALTGHGFARLSVNKQTVQRYMLDSYSTNNSLDSHLLLQYG